MPEGEHKPKTGFMAVGFLAENSYYVDVIMKLLGKDNVSGETKSAFKTALDAYVDEQWMSKTRMVQFFRKNGEPVEDGMAAFFTIKLTRFLDSITIDEFKGQDQDLYAGSTPETRKNMT